MTGLASCWCRGWVEHIFVFVFPPSLKIHYTTANGDLMRTSLVDRPSCVAQGRLIAARFPDRAVWKDRTEKSDGADSQTDWWLGVPHLWRSVWIQDVEKMGVVMPSREGSTKPRTCFFSFLFIGRTESMHLIPFQVDKIIVSRAWELFWYINMHTCSWSTLTFQAKTCWLQLLLKQWSTTQTTDIRSWPKSLHLYGIKLKHFTTRNKCLKNSLRIKKELIKMLKTKCLQRINTIQWQICTIWWRLVYFWIWSSSEINHPDRIRVTVHFNRTWAESLSACSPKLYWLFDGLFG